MLKLDRLIIAMAAEEGWKSPLEDAVNGGSRSYRNKNPLNLRKSPFEIGTLGGFSVFNTDMDGFAAARWDILQKARGNTSTGLTGESSLADLLAVWAPISDGNDTGRYIKNVCYMSGLEPSMKLKDLLYF